MVAIGPGKWVKDKKTKEMKRHEFQVKEGDQVIFAPDSAVALEAEGYDYYLIEEHNIIGIIV